MRSAHTAGANIKDRRRVAEFGEVFTPAWLVSDMCDLLEPDISDPAKTVLEPACGNGNFLVEILRRKLAKCSNVMEVLTAAASIYGVDIMQDNILECRQRLLELIPGDARHEASEIFKKNIVVGDFLKPQTIWFLKNRTCEQLCLI